MEKNISSPTALESSRDFLKNLSKEQSEQLERFLRYLFAHHTFGYTLFGNKPISFCFIPSGVSYMDFSINGFRIPKVGDHSYSGGVSILDEWAKRHSKGSYILNLFYAPGKPGLSVIINRSALKKAFDSNLDLFMSNFSDKIAFDDLLIKLNQKETYFNQLFNQHVILGVLLGYGRTNAEKFEKRQRLMNNCSALPITLRALSIRQTALLNHSLDFKPQKDLWTSLVVPVCFLSDPNLLETQILKQEYENCHSELTELFRNQDWQEKILSRLAD